MTTPAWGTGLSTITSDGATLDAWYPTGHLGLGNRPADEAKLPALAGPAVLDGMSVVEVATSIGSLADAPANAADAYLRLHLLSHRMIRPHQANLEGIFALLANVAWTSAGPCPPDRVDDLRYLERASGRHLTVYGVDKFPRMVDYVVPSGVRIADADRVRLGAHLAAGTTVMHEGFCNFNAGTLGTSMIEGRITAGVVVGDGSDIGGGSSILGTLSGGGKVVVSIGQRCLIGANGGVGITLGDDCVVEAGLYVMPGTKVTLPNGDVVKASALSAEPGILFIRNSVTGAVEARPRSGEGIALNAALHAHN
ncbi:MAG TPA: 2,3,4,5-tetrahydropyridine-2,6-dicarboxylate N-succinyltransferase [Micromonosporaceae bacterium]